MTYQTHRRWWTVADAARVLRVHTDTLYDACRNDDFPHTRLWEGGPIRIDCRDLCMQWVPEAPVRPSKPLAVYDPMDDPLQMTLPLGPIKTVRTWRNTGKPVGVWSYERDLWKLDNAR